MLYLNEKIVAQLVLRDMCSVMRDMEMCLSLLDKGEAISPAKCVLCRGNSAKDELEYGRINALPGYVGGEFHMAGIKWIGTNFNNSKRGLPSASGIVILNDPDTMQAVAVVDGSDLSAKRTGAIGGIAVKYLSMENAKTLLICGAGTQGRTQLEAILVARPSIRRVYVYDLDPKRAEQYAAEAKEKYDVEAVPTMEVGDAAKESDIIVTVTLATEPFIRADWLKKGALLVNMANDEVTFDAIRKAGKVVVDNWEAIKHRMISSLAVMYQKGEFREETIYAALGEIINRKKPGRENDGEVIYFNAVGMGIEDICLAARAYQKALQLGVGMQMA